MLFTMLFSIMIIMSIIGAINNTKLRCAEDMR